MIIIPSFSDADNETRVRESLVAPLLRALGYAEEEILPEVTMKVRVQDEIKQVRADYVISAEHIFGLPMNRLVVEVKRPTVPVEGQEVLEQARLYASHYSVQASHVVLVNGVHLCIYEPSGPLLNLVQKFEVKQLNASWDKLNTLIGAESFRRQFAGMEIIELIGSGGYGQVFKARNLKLGRIEALKILLPSAEGADSIRRRFERGAQGLAALEHPYICRVFELDVYRGRPYYRMELIPGVSLTDFVRQRGLSFEERLRLFRQICEALSHAHRQGVIHCDLKPENVLVTHDATPKLIDFDFCHLGTGASTILSQVVATIAYMDPTIWKDAKNRDERADIYSMGLLLWSTVTGEDLRPGWTPHFLVNELSRAGAEAEGFGALILRCLQENRNDRPETIEEFLGLLGIKDTRMSSQSLLDGSVSNFTVHSPEREFEYRFRLWQQTGDLPGGVDFDRITKGIPQRTLTEGERNFIYRATCIHWSRKYRSLFKSWSADDMIAATRAVLEDRSVNAAHEGKTGESHPARQAVDILASTDEYHSASDSEKIADFLLHWLPGEKRKSIFGTTLGDLARLQCFKKRRPGIRKQATKILMELLRVRLSNPDSQIGRLLETLSPDKCGEDSADVAQFIRDVARQPALWDRAVQTLGCFENPAATDSFIDILEEARGTAGFEKAALIAIGVNGRYKRPLIAAYLSELKDFTPSEKLQRAIKALSE